MRSGIFRKRVECKSDEKYLALKTKSIQSIWGGYNVGLSNLLLLVFVLGWNISNIWEEVEEIEFIFQNSINLCFQDINWFGLSYFGAIIEVEGVYK